MTGTGWNEAWVAALDALEADVVAVESLLAEDHRIRDLPAGGSWAPPQGLGPLPLELRPRADQSLSRQLAATQALAVAMVANRRQAELAARIEADRQSAPRPAYVDCAM